MLIRFAFLLFFLTFTAVHAADDWRQFRGPNGQGHSDSTGLPIKLDAGENVKWKTPIAGKAWSSPVVLGDQVWLSSATADGHQLFAICVDRNTGRIVHDLKLFDIPNPQFCVPFNSYASPSPAIEEGRVYITFGSPGTACLDTKTGKVLWERRDLQCNHWRSAGSSPILFENLLIMPFDGADYQYIIALDKMTGKTAWKTDRSIDFQDLGPDGKPEAGGDWRKAFSTPTIADFGQGPILLSLGSKALYAYEPRGGKEIWRVENRATHSGSATPVFGQGLIFTCTGFGKGHLWAVRPGGSGVVTDTHVAWKVTRNVPNKPTPLLVNDLLYMVDDNGIASCLEAQSGKDVWRQRIPGNYSAAPVYADGRIYFFSEDGKTTTIAPGCEFKQLANGQFPDGFMASPAVAGKSFFLRTRADLYRIEMN